MKTVRFSQVVAAAGKPEVYLLFAQDDPEFQKALKHDRIMTILERGSSPSYGVVGHEPGHHGQLLLFPKSLKKFADVHVVGIKFDLFAESSSGKAKEDAHAAPSHAGSRKSSAKKPKGERKSKAAPRAEKKPESAPHAEKPATRKVIAFPQAELSEEDERVGKLKAQARRALQALEQGDRQAASRHLLRLLKG